MAVHVQSAVLILGVLLAGCGSDPPPPPKAAPPPAPAPAPRMMAPASEEPEDGIRLSGEGVLGSLSDDQIQAPIQQRWSEILRCKQQFKPPWYVGGRIALHFRVARDGERVNHT